MLAPDPGVIGDLADRLRGRTGFARFEHMIRERSDALRVALDHDGGDELD